jgi:tRNA-splicing ligase RtcB
MSHRVFEDVPVWGEPVDPGALEQIRRCRVTAVRAAMMADHHLGYAVPIGGVVAYQDAVSPSGVGYDIACGNKAVRLDVPASEVRAHIHRIMDAIAANISFGIGRVNDTPVDHELFDDPAWRIPAVARLKSMARAQLGTVGGGNHYVDVFVDEQERVWIGVHFGSRGFGYKTATWFLRAGHASEAIHAPPLVLRMDEMGQEYVECMRLAGRYAYAGRDWVCGEVARLIGARIVEEVHNHHNFAWLEEHGGESLWVIRKGATPAWPGQRGFVGGSMGENAVIIEGVDGDEAALAMRSTVHGAGRAMSRNAARGKLNHRTGRILSVGAISRSMMDEWVSRAGVVLRGGDTDEAPQAYKRLPEVLAHHAGSIRVLHQLKPLGVAMAGREVYDPFKD